MKKILFYARDPGAANCIIPVYEKIKESGQCGLVLWGKDFALKLYRNNRLAFKDVTKLIRHLDKKNIKRALLNARPDAVVSGVGSNDLTDRLLWLAAKELQIPVITILDQWQNYRLRFSLSPLGVKADTDLNLDVLPNKICVMDRLAKKEMMQEGFPSSIIEVTGQPHFERISKDLKKITRRKKSEFKNKLGVSRKDYLLTFVSEPIIESYKNHLFLGYNQLTILTYVIRCLERVVVLHKTKSIFLIIKLHPRSNRRIIDDFLKKQPPVGFKVAVVVDVSPALIISASDLILGMSSMFLLESVLAKKPIISVQIGLKRKNLFVLSRIGYQETILSPKILYKEIKKNINGRFHKTVHLSFPKHSVDNIFKIIKQAI